MEAEDNNRRFRTKKIQALPGNGKAFVFTMLRLVELLYGF
jgi:hypothetical protein